MMKCEEKLIMKAVAICFKPYLKTEEALIYCDLGRTQFAKKCEEFGVYKNSSGYFKKEDIDNMLSGGTSLQLIASDVEIGIKNKEVS